MRKTIAAVTAAAALLLISAPVAVADDPIQIASFGVTPATVDLTGADQQVDFTVVTSAGTNTVTGVSVDLAGIGAVLTSGDSTNWAGSLSVPSTFKAGTYQAVVTAVGGGGQQATDSKSVVVRTQPVISLTRTPTTPKAGGNYLVSGSIKEPNGAGVLVGMAATLTLTGPGYSSTFAVGSTGAFHHSVSHALPATWTASYAGNTTHLATSASMSVSVSANPTRFVSFDAGPEPAYRGGSIAVHGYLQRYSPTLARWVAYGGQRVTISRVSPSGYATARTTTSTGYFAALIRGANIVETAGWHASFAGWSTGSTVVNGASVSSGDAVAAVTAPLRITRVYYDGPGSDLPVSNAKLNAEYVIITNAGSRTANLYRWSVSDPKGHTYVFSGNIYLSPGRSVVLHTGSGPDSGGQYYWGQGYYVWNNTGDTAYLRSDLNYLVDRCSWGDGPGFTNC
jgi:hypothetical protein